MRSRTRTNVFARRKPPSPGAARICVMSCLVLALVPTYSRAQEGGVDGPARPALASRGALDSLATKTQVAADAAETPVKMREPLRRYAADLRSRLRSGDFQPGDRIIVITRADSTRVDTLTVQSDRTIVLQQLPPISLDGILRSELQSCLSQQLQQYVKHGVVQAIPLVPVGVLGEVVHPGYYRVPLQITLGDLLMVAGGPLPQADMTRIEVRRGRAAFIDAHSARDAMVHRLPLDQLGVDAGDEVVLRAAPQRNWPLITQVAGVAAGIALTLHSLKVF
jgi:SLBB domain